MSTLRFLSRPIVAAVALLGAAAILGGCSGSQSGATPQTSMQVPPQYRAPILPDAASDAAKCTHQGNVKVKPCSVDFTTGNPGPATVTVKSPKSGTVSESDNCGGATGDATVNQADGDSWVVTAGASTGSCTATFESKNKNGKVTGSADLAITNAV